MSSYRIGASDFFTSADLLADAKTLNGQINALDDGDWTKPSQQLFDGWNAFVSEWRGFYSSTFGGLFNFSAWNDSNRDQLIQFEERFNVFAGQFQAATGQTLPGGVVAPSTGAKDSLAEQIKAQLQPLIPSIDVGKVLLVVGLVGGAAAIYMFREPIGRALGAGA